MSERFQSPYMGIAALGQIRRSTTPSGDVMYSEREGQRSSAPQSIWPVLAIKLLGEHDSVTMVTHPGTPVTVGARRKDGRFFPKLYPGVDISRDGRTTLQPAQSTGWHTDLGFLAIFGKRSRSGKQNLAKLKFTVCLKGKGTESLDSCVSCWDALLDEISSEVPTDKISEKHLQELQRLSSTNLYLKVNIQSLHLKKKYLKLCGMWIGN